jgi:DNA-binding CsgD family transcriptional regulator
MLPAPRDTCLWHRHVDRTGELLCDVPGWSAGFLGENDVVGTERVPQATGVSAREAEVLAGIAEHLTNAEIADRLFISVRTVESHVSSLLRKLGVSDRRALAGLAAAAAHGLAPSQPQRPAALPPAPLTP